MKIVKIPLYYMRNKAHHGFLESVRKLLAAYPDVQQIVIDLLPEFNMLRELEATLIDNVRKSFYTGAIVEANNRLDRDIVGINMLVESNLRHFDPAVAEAARILEIRMKSYSGYIEKKAYEEESEAVHLLLDGLQGEMSPQVTALNLDGWVTELAAALEDFDRLLALRIDEKSKRPKAKIRAVRKRAEAAYRRITDRIDAYYVLNGGDATELFIKRINQEIAYFHEYNLSHHKTAIDRITVAPIPVQIYDGKPVVLIPDVSLEDTELVFARDYELTFKNNTRPGLARFTIRGKGAYRGRKTVSFNIAFDNPKLTIVNYQS